MCQQCGDHHDEPFLKNSLVLAVAGVVTLAAASPASARTWRYGAAAGAGLVAGAALAGASAAAYGSGYDAYAYVPGASPRASGYTNYRSDGSDGYSGCATDGNYAGRTDFGAC